MYKSPTNPRDIYKGYKVPARGKYPCAWCNAALTCFEPGQICGDCANNHGIVCQCWDQVNWTCALQVIHGICAVGCGFRVSNIEQPPTIAPGSQEASGIDAVADALINNAWLPTPWKRP